MGLRISDFEEADQHKIQPVNHNLLALAKQNNLRVTGGFANGGHNTGSKHYQGTPDNPGAIDVDPGAVTPDKIQQWQAQGYTVRDERTHPKGQDKWTGPHYHLEVGNTAGNHPTQRQTPQPMAQPKELIAPFDGNSLQMPTTTDAQGNLVINKPGKQRDIGKEISQAVKPEPKRQVADTISLSNFDLDQNDQAEIQAIADRLKPKAQPQAVQPEQKPQTNFFGDVYNHALNAAAGYSQDELLRQSGQGVGAAIGDIAGGLVPIGGGTAAGAGLGALSLTPFGVAAGAVGGGIAGAGGAGVAQDLQSQRLAGAKELNIPRALGSGAIQGGLQAVPIVGKGLSLIPRIAANAALHGGAAGAGAVVQQGIEQGTLTPKVDAQRTLGMAGLGAAGGGLSGALHANPKAEANPVPKEVPAQKELPHFTGGTEGDLVRHIADNTRRTRPIETMGLAQLNPADMTANPKELTPAFKARGGVTPGQAKGNLDAQILGADGRPVPQSKSNFNKTPYELALEKSRPSPEGAPPPQIETASAPTPRKSVEVGSLPNHTNPLTGKPYEISGTGAKESASVLGGHLDDIKTAEQLHTDAVSDLHAKENALLEAGGSTDQVEAQRAVGARVNELEAKASEGSISHPELEELQQKRTILDGVLKAREAAADSEKLLNETKAPIERSSLPAEAPKSKEIGISSTSGDLPSTRELAFRRADALDQQSRELHGVDTTSPRISEGPGAGIQKPAPREIGPSILDAQGNPIRRETPVIERVGKSEPKALELPESYQRPQPKEAGTIARAADSVPTEQVSKNVQQRPDGGHVYTQGREAEAVDQIAQSLEKNNQILALEDAKKLLADKKANGLLSPEEFRKQSDILNLFHEAGRTGKTFQSMRREIKEGEGRISKELGKAEVKSRDNLSPFAITVKARKPATEVSNLVKRLGSPEAARDQLRQMAGKYGITPTTKGRTVAANARKIAEQITNHPKGQHEFSDIYLNAHNFKTGGEKTLTDAPRGYPLRTFEGANIGTELASIPKGALNQNTIAKHFEALDAIRNSPGATPEMKQAVTKVIDNPGASFKDIRKMRKLVSENLESFCKVWSLK